MSRRDDLTPETDPRPHRAQGRANLIRWGGIGIAAAAATAFGILASRAVADLLAGDQEDRPRPRQRDSLAPRFAELDEEDRRAMRARARADIADYEDRSAALRDAALRRRHEQERELRRRRRARQRRSFVADLGDSAGRLATNITALLAAANAAADGFQQISGRADGIIRDFSGTADRLRDFLGSKAQPAPDEAPGDAPKAAATQDRSRERDRTHRM